MDATPWRAYHSRAALFGPGARFGCDVPLTPQGAPVEGALTSSELFARLLVSRRSAQLTEPARLAQPRDAAAEERRRLERLRTVPRVSRVKTERGLVAASEHDAGRRQGKVRAFQYGALPRVPPTHMAQDRLRRLPVYDEPFQVLNHYVLSGERDEEVMRTQAEQSALLVPATLPAHAAAQHGLAPGQRRVVGAQAFRNEARRLARADPRSFFRLLLPRSRDAAGVLQRWWRGVLGRARAARLRETLLVTRRDPETGRWLRTHIKTGKVEWL